MPSRLLIVSFSVCPAPDRHGVGLLNVIKALASRHTVDVLTLRPAPGGSFLGGVELPFVERFMKTRMLRVPVGHGTLAEKVEAFSRAIRRQLEGEEYDVIHLRSAWGGRAILDGNQSARVVYEVARSTEGEPRAADEALARKLAEEESICLERADMVLVPTARGRQHLLERGVDPHRVFVVPPGVDVDHFDWEEEGHSDRVLFAGQIGGGRGVRLLATAVGQIRRRRPVKLMLAGSVEEAFRPSLDQALAEAGLAADDVELLGPIDHDDMPRVIAQATVCAAPASPDASSHRPLAGFPTKLLEYMACKRSVVAPRSSSVEEVVEDGQDGLLFDPGDADDLASAVGRLLDDAGLRHALAESGYRRVRQEFPASATRRRLLEAYASLLPSSEWLPPGRGAPSIDALPSSPDTTAKRPSPYDRDWAEVSGMIIIDEVPPEEAEPKEIVIEAVDFEEAGEARDATIEPMGAAAVVASVIEDETVIAVTTDAVVEVHTDPRVKLPGDFEEESKTHPFGVRLPESGEEVPDFVAAGPLLGPNTPAADLDTAEGETTQPGPLRTRRPSG